MDSYATVNNTASITSPAEEEGVLSGTVTATINVSPPPSLLISRNTTSVRLASGLGVSQGGDGEGPSRGPKLRRLASFGDEITSQPHLSGQVATTDLAEFRSPSVASASSAATNVAAALVQLQQQAAVAAAIPSTVTFLSSLANSSSSSTANSLQSQHRQLSHQLHLIGDASLSSSPSVVPPIVDSNAVTLATDLGSAVSLSAGVEQIVAAAINTATASLPQTIAAIAAATAFPPQNASPCAVCAAAACQSRMGPSMAAAVTACSCLHHHHHHLHCHHNSVLPASPFPVCTLCNHVAGGVSPSPSSTTSMAHNQPHQSLNSPNLHQTGNMNNSCINATGTSIVSNSQGNNRFAVNGGDTSLQSATQIRPIAQRYLAMNSSAFISNANNGSGGMERVPLTNNISANVNIHATSGGSAAMVAAAALSPSNVIAMLLNSAAALGQQQNSLPHLVHTAPYRNFPVMDDFTAAHNQSLPNMTSVQQNLLASRLVQQERERDVVNQVNQQQQQPFPVWDDFSAAQSLPNMVQQNLLATRLQQERDAVNNFNQQQHFPVMGDFTAAQSLQNVTSMQQNLLATRLVQQEREREAVNNFYQQQQQQRTVQQNHLVRPLIMVPRLSSQLDLANVLLLHNPGSVDDAATLVLNGGASVTSALAHATNPHHIVANAMATATAPEPQPVGVSLEQIKKHSQKLSYVKDPDVPEQERDRCTVCLSDFDTGDELRALNCTHLFHTECIDRWLQYNKKCPVCRVDMDKGGAGSSAMAAEAAVMLNAYAAAAAASTTSNSTTC